MDSEKEWDALYIRYEATRGADSTKNWLKTLAQVRRTINSTPKDKAAWVVQALKDEQKKWMVAHAFSVTDGDEAFPIPTYLVEPSLRAGVYERDPSFNKHFILPCMASVGYSSVNEALLEYVEHGTTYEKVGAINALYWASFRFKYRSEVTNWFWNPETNEPFWEKLTPKCLAEYKATRDISHKMQYAFLNAFINDDDLHIRRSIIARLNINPEDYPAELHPLVSKALGIAVNHPDEYIQSRIQLKLGKERTINPLPHRL
jgi:hypothetical protein